jgi:hypothetical protein
VGQLRDRFSPSVVKLWGCDSNELRRYSSMMSPSVGVRRGSPTKFIELLGRKWYVSNIEWEGFPILYEITLTTVVEIKLGSR